MRRRWGLLLLIALVLGALLLLLRLWSHSEAVNRWVLNRVAGLYDQEFRSSLHVDRLQIDLLSLSLEAWGVTVSEPGAGGSRAPIRVARVRATFLLAPLLSKTVHLRSVVLERPQVLLRIGENGTDNLSRLFQGRRPSPGKTPWNFFAEKVTVSGGDLNVSDAATGGSARADNLHVQGSFDLAAGLIAARFQIGAGEMQWSGFRAPLRHLAGEVTWQAKKKQIRVSSLRLELPGLKGRGAGTLSLGKPFSLSAMLDARVRPSALSSWWPQSALKQFRGSYTFKGKVTGVGNKWRASGEAGGSKVAVAGVPLSNLSLLWRWSPARLFISRLQVALGGGNMEGEGEIRFPQEGNALYQGEARWGGVALEDVFPSLPLGLFRNLSGSTSGQAGFSGGGEAGPGPHVVEGRVAVEAKGEGARKMGIPPLTLEADVAFAGDRFHVSRAILNSRGLTVEPQGDLGLDGRVDLRFSFRGEYRAVWDDYLGWKGKAREVNGQGRLSGNWDEPVLEVRGKLAAGVIAGVSFSHLGFSGRWEGTSLQVDKIRLESPGGAVKGKARFLVAGNLFGKKPSPFLRGIPELDLDFAGVQIPYLQEVLKKSWPVAGTLKGSFSGKVSPQGLQGNGQVEWLQGRWKGVRIPLVQATVTLDSLRPGQGASARILLKSRNGEVPGFDYDQFAADLSVVVKNRFRTAATRGRVEVEGGRFKGAAALFSHLSLQGSGEIDGRGPQIFGTGQSTLEIQGGTWGGEPFSSLQASLRLTNSREFRVDRLAVALPSGTLRGGGYYRWNGGEWSGELTAPGLDLSKIRKLVSQGSEPRGVARIHLSGRGGKKGVDLDGELQLSGLRLWRQNLGGGKITLRGRGQKIQWTGEGFGGYQLHGSLELTGAYPFSLSVAAAQSNLPAFIQQVTGGKAEEVTRELSGSFAGEATLSGILRPRPKISGRLHLDQLTASLYGVRLSNEGPVELAYQGGEVAINRFHLGGGGTDFSVSGSATLGGKVNLAVKGKGSLALLSGQIPQIRISRGAVEADMKIGGSAGNPQITGAVHLREGAFALTALGQEVADLSADGEFSAGRLRLYQFQGRLEAGGSFRGSAEYQIAGGEKGNFRVILDGEGMALHYPADLSSRVNAQLLIEGRPGEKILSGQVVIERAVYRRQIDLKSLLFQLRQRRLKPFGGQGQLDLRVEIISRNGILIDTNLGRLEMGADFMLSGNLQHPRLTGRAEVNKGKIIFRGTEFVVSSGTVDFFDPNRFVPYFDLVAQATVKSYQITLSVDGTPDQFNVNLTSDPPLSEVDLVSLITTGQTGSQTSPGAEVAARGASTYLAGELGKEFEKGVRQITGLDRFQVDPYVVDSKQGAGPRVTVGKDLSKDLSVTYSSIVGDTGSQVFQVEYRLTRSLSLVGVRDEIGNTGVDLKFSFRFR